MSKELLSRFNLDDNMEGIINSAASVTVPETRAHLLELAMGGEKEIYKVEYDIDGKMVTEATVTLCKNGVSVNYPEAYMRRRDPSCTVIGDDLPTDKTTYKSKYGTDFEEMRQLTFDSFKGEDIILMPFTSGDPVHGGYESIIIAPKNAAFFVGGLGDLQGQIEVADIRDGFTPKAVIYLAPSFRLTHFEGKQVVVHNRLDEIHEVYSFNLYPGPSAKKGIYGVLLTIGEREDWITAHASTVRVVTPYDNSVGIMHEGASGGGKSEMIEEVHRETDGSVLFAEGTVEEDDKIFIELGDTCEVHPVTDDMALCHPSYQNGKKLVVSDAEAGWFLRFDHIKSYGSSPEHEKLTIHPPEPLIFLNMQATPGSTILIWEHTMDEPGKPCPNPRVVMPRRFMPDVLVDPVEIDIRSFGVRMPPCTKEAPTYGIVGMLHILPPALAWIWRLVAPRGHANPSILDTGGMKSEGVGSYWPFCTGMMVTQANLLLDQIVKTPDTRYVLIPNQHIGSYVVGFKAEWLDREYLARKGSAKFRPEQLVESKCSTLGWSPKTLRIDGHSIPKKFLRVNHQLSIGEEAYDQGAVILTDFFKRELAKFDTPELNPLGKKIIDAYMKGSTVAEFEALLPQD